MTEKTEKRSADKKFVLAGLFVVLILIGGMRLLVLSKTLGNIKGTHTVPETGTSGVSFSGKAGSRIRISFASRIEHGSLEVTIRDSAGTAVKELDHARELKDFLILEDTDVYTLEAEYVEFVGEYRVSLFQWN